MPARFATSWRTANPLVLGENLDLNGAAFHGHWQLCQFLIENGADVNRPLAGTGESALHSALCKANRPLIQIIP